MKYAASYKNIQAGAFVEGDIGIFEDADIAALFPARRPDLHKGNCGTAVILGGDGSPGAAFLSAGACLKSGAGYTKLYFPPALYPYAIGKLPACVLRAFSGVDDELLDADCIALGMGAGVSEELYHLIEELLASYEGTLLLDADALNAVGRYGVDVLKAKRGRVVVTPHPMEFSRITGIPVQEILQDPINCAKAFAREYGVTVVLKNYLTVITDGEQVAVNRTGSPAMAKGGSGDVLSGFLAGSIARGLAPFEGAVAGCYIAGRAGELAAAGHGEYSPDASDLIAHIGKAILSVQTEKRP